MSTITAIDPVTRLEGHLKVEVEIELVGGQLQVIDAHATGALFRGFEAILQGRTPADAQHITQRICGVCPVSHGMAAVMAQEAAAGVVVPTSALLMRNMVLGANYIQSHILHFYHLAVLDFIEGPGMAPWQPSWDVDRRLDAATTAVLVSHYVQALTARRRAHELGAILGGKLPHTPTFFAGGITAKPNRQDVAAMSAYLDELLAFITSTYVPDVELLAEAYPDYRAIGAGYGNLLAYGAFDLDNRGRAKLFRPGRVVNGQTTVEPIHLPEITEHVTSSWYDDATDGLNPSEGATVPLDPASKGWAYSWLKAPRYAGAPYEVGPLARMWVNGHYQEGISVMDRHLARAYEALKVAQHLQSTLGAFRRGTTTQVPLQVPPASWGAGLTEAPRGALGHWLNVDHGGDIANYQVITPTCWNASPRDPSGALGPLEQALLGTPVQDPDRPIEVTRVVHSFDPCLACAVHVMRPAQHVRVFALPNVHGAEEGETRMHEGAGARRSREPQ